MNIDDNWTLKLEKLLLDIAKSANVVDKRYFIGGGFAIDLTFGELTRPHEDIDFHPEEKDSNWWKDWFKDQGLILSKDPDMEDYPNAFLPTNKNKDYFADVYPVKFEANGKISLLYKDGTHSIWKGKSWKDNKRVNYKGVSIYVENYKTVLKQKKEYAKEKGIPLSEKHLHDFNLFKNKYLGQNKP